MNPKMLLLATSIGFVLQLAMVVAGHFLPVVQQGFAIGGMAISFVAGLIYGRLAAGHWANVLLSGALCGGLSAVLAIAVSVGLHDVPAIILAIGTAASTLTGLLGGGAGKLLRQGA
jgi:hypothetical protein